MQTRKGKNQPFALAIETSARAGSVAIGIADRVLGEASFSGPMRHSAELFPAIDKLLQKTGADITEIEHIFVSIGPGSFTGIRIAATIAKTLHFANRTRIVAVDSLDVIACNGTDYMHEKNLDISRLGAILDAKRGQFYAAVFDNKDNRWVKVVPDCLITSEEFINRFASSEEPLWLLGEGLVFYSDIFRTAGINLVDKDYWSAKARNVYFLGWKMALAGQFADPVRLVPFYLRGPDAKVKTCAK